MTMKTKWRSRPALALGALLLATPASGAAQQADDALVERPLASREALQALASRLEQGKGPVADNSLLARVRTRLEEGDLRPGDRVLLEVEGEKALSDTKLARANAKRELAALREKAKLPPAAVQVTQGALEDRLNKDASYKKQLGAETMLGHVNLTQASLRRIDRCAGQLQ